MRVAKLISNDFAPTAASETGFANALFYDIKAGGKFRDAIDKDGHNIYELPLPVNGKQKAALKNAQEIQYSDAVDQWANMTKATNALYEIKDVFGFRVLDEKSEASLEVLRNDFFNGVYGSVPKNKKKINGEDFKNWVKGFQSDVRRFAKNYQAGSDAVNDFLTQKAINDLRASGWKFIGFDQPNA